MVVAVPDLTSRPFHLTVTRQMAASPAALFRAWTEQLDRWFAAPGTLLMTPRVDAPFFFETRYAGEAPPALWPLPAARARSARGADLAHRSRGHEGGRDGRHSRIDAGRHGDCAPFDSRRLSGRRITRRTRARLADRVGAPRSTSAGLKRTRFRCESRRSGQRICEVVSTRMETRDRLAVFLMVKSIGSAPCKCRGGPALRVRLEQRRLALRMGKTVLGVIRNCTRAGRDTFAIWDGTLSSGGRVGSHFFDR